MNKIIAELLQTKAHIGNKNWNKESAPFLLGFRKSPRIHRYAILNLEKTVIALNQILHFLEKLKSDKVQDRSAQPSRLDVFAFSITRQSSIVPETQEVNKKKLLHTVLKRPFENLAVIPGSNAQFGSADSGVLRTPELHTRFRTLDTRPVHVLVISTGVSSSIGNSGSLQLNLSRLISNSRSFVSNKNEFIENSKIVEKQKFQLSSTTNENIPVIFSFTQDKWVGGTLTNWKQITQSISVYSQFKNRFDIFLKKHNIQFPIYQKYDKRYQGLHELVFSLPDVIIVTNPEENDIALKEANILKIPVIGFINSETHLNFVRNIDYPIPGNNKSPSFIYFCLNLFFTVLRCGVAVQPR